MWNASSSTPARPQTSSSGTGRGSVKAPPRAPAVRSSRLCSVRRREGFTVVAQGRGSARTRTLAFSALLLIGTSVLLAGCSKTVSVQAAPDANNPDCAEVTVRLPETVVGMERQWTDAQATGAWGDPTRVILRCGVDVPGPSTLPCLRLGGVDWLILPQEKSLQVAVTFGRDPAVEVAMSRDEPLDFASVLDSLGSIIASADLPRTGQACS